MGSLHKVTIHDKKLDRTITLDVPEGEYILRSFESHGEQLPFSCRNGCCTTCAVKVISGELDQNDGIGLSKAMIAKGYALLCIAKATGPLVVETQDEDEVYQLQFGNNFGDIEEKMGNPFEI